MMEALFGYLRLGKIAQVVSEPVISGFLNAFALFLIKSQVNINFFNIIFARLIFESVLES